MELLQSIDDLVTFKEEDFDKVIVKVKELYTSCFFEEKPKKDLWLDEIEAAAQYIKELFAGKVDGYHSCDTKYPDLEHALEVTVAQARILNGMFKEKMIKQKSTAKKKEYMRLFAIGTIASLMHDTGYMRRKDVPEEEIEGMTGAYFTSTHIGRSAKYARKYLRSRNNASQQRIYSEDDIYDVGKMIFCTGIDPKPSQIRFSSEGKRLVGFALGTADYLSQMAADNYYEKLPELHREFKEGSIKPFSDKDDQYLINNTPKFWKDFVEPKLIIDEFSGVYKYLNNWRDDGLKLYTDAIYENLKKINPDMPLLKLPD